VLSAEIRSSWIDSAALSRWFVACQARVVATMRVITTPNGTDAHQQEASSLTMAPARRDVRAGLRHRRCAHNVGRTPCHC